MQELMLSVLIASTSGPLQPAALPGVSVSVGAGGHGAGARGQGEEQAPRWTPGGWERSRLRVCAHTRPQSRVHVRARARSVACAYALHQR